MNEEYREEERLFFMSNRDGVGAAMDFAKKGLQQYTTALNTPNHFSRLPHYRPGYEASIRVFKRFLSECIA